MMTAGPGRAAGRSMRGRRMAWLAIVGAVLSGLFFMHGISAAIGGGHGPAVMAAMTMMQAPRGGRRGRQPRGGRRGCRRAVTAGGTRAPVSATAAAAMAAPYGTLCAAAPRRGWLTATVQGAAIGLPVLALGAGRPRRPARRPGRVRALPGRALLGRLCVART
jgi:hypothetical protein